MPTVLGIDAAWTATQPSGVAVASFRDGRWRLLGVASSYNDFELGEGGRLMTSKPLGSHPNANTLLGAAATLAGESVDLVAIDMPLARTPITERRTSDDAVSIAYGSRKCSTHTPSVTRPGPISDRLRFEFEAAGYPLRTSVFEGRGLVEVYPHPALVELTGAPERLPYKASKVSVYWRSDDRGVRRTKLLAEWRNIVGHLDRYLIGASDLLTSVEQASAGWQLKAFEDALDATVCAVVAICVLEGRALPFGDQESAIWIPRPAAGNRMTAGEPSPQ